MRTGDAESETIVEYAAGKIVSIDHKKKEYSEITLAEMEAAMKAAAAKMEEANAQMKQQMAAMPPAMREKMEQMMGGGASSVTVTKGGTRQVAGYTCQDYTVAMGQTMTTKVCATTALQFPAPNVDYRKFASFAGVGRGHGQQPHVQGHGEDGRRDEEDRGLHDRRVDLDEDDGPQHRTARRRRSRSRRARSPPRPSTSPRSRRATRRSPTPSRR